MSVNPGFGGQRFIPSQLGKIEALRALIDASGCAVDLSVDGGIDEQTAGLASGAGADVLVAGSASFAGGRADYPGNIARLRAAGEAGAHGLARHPRRAARYRRVGLLIPPNSMGARDEQASEGFLGALRRLRRRASRRGTSEQIPQLLHRSIDLVQGLPGAAKHWPRASTTSAAKLFAPPRSASAATHPGRHKGAGEYWLAELHGFAWLRDLNAAGTGQAAERGRAMVLDWLRQHRTIESAAVSAWGPETLGRRLTAWLAHSAFLLQGADDEFARRFHQALELQASHLTRTARNADEGLPQLIACRGRSKADSASRRVSGASRKASSSSKRRSPARSRQRQSTRPEPVGAPRGTMVPRGAAGDPRRGRAPGVTSALRGDRPTSRRHCACSATATAGSPCSTAALRRSGA